MKCSELLRKIKQDGWYEVRQKGSHIILLHPIKGGHVIFPNHGSQKLKPGTLHSILKMAGLK